MQKTPKEILIIQELEAENETLRSQNSDGIKEVQRLEKELKDFKDDYDSIYKESCSIQYGEDDKTHCTCVPGLRKSLKECLEALKEAKEGFDHVWDCKLEPDKILCIAEHERFKIKRILDKHKGR